VRACARDCVELASLGRTRGVARDGYAHAEPSSLPCPGPSYALSARSLPPSILGFADLCWLARERQPGTIQFPVFDHIHSRLHTLAYALLWLRTRLRVGRSTGLWRAECLDAYSRDGERTGGNGGRDAAREPRWVPERGDELPDAQRVGARRSSDTASVPLVRPAGAAPRPIGACNAANGQQHGVCAHARSLLRARCQRGSFGVCGSRSALGCDRRSGTLGFQPRWCRQQRVTIDLFLLFFLSRDIFSSRLSIQLVPVNQLSLHHVLESSCPFDKTKKYMPTLSSLCLYASFFLYAVDI
jgi:hypothetical protein